MQWSVKNTLFFIVLSPLLVFQTAISREYYSSQILICFQKDVTGIETVLRDNKVSTRFESFNLLCQNHGVYQVERWLTSASEQDIDGEVKLANIYRIKFTGRQSVDDMVSDFKQNRWVFSAEKEPIVRASTLVEPYVPSDPFIANQWFVNNVFANWAWGLWTNLGKTPGDTSIVVGIVDSGTQWDHPDLKENIWVNPAEDLDGDGVVGDFGTPEQGGDEDGIDNDGNGKIDDLVGWDFIGQSLDSIRQDNNPMAGAENHGTAVAGCVSASTDNDIGVTGIGFRVKLLISKHAPDGPSQFITNGYDGILYAAKSGADVINCSWGGEGRSAFEQNTINVAYNTYGAIVVAAAGNDGKNLNNFNQYPAEYDHVVCAAGTNIDDRKSSFSNYGNSVDISAPATNIYTTDTANKYQYINGTSFSSPIVAGGFALLKSMFPDSGNPWLENRIKQSADNIDDVNPDYVGLLGGGRMNLFQAIGQPLLPKISYKAFSLLITNDDGDGLLNPGEEAILRVTLQNEMGWKSSENVTGVLSTTDPNFTIIDSVSDFGRMNSGSVAINLATPFRFAVDSLALNGDYHFNLQARTISDYFPGLEMNIPIIINVSTFQKGWPVGNLGLIQSSPLITKAHSQTGANIFIGNNNGRFLAWDARGDSLGGFPLELGGQIWGSPALGDVDNDGSLEIVVGSTSGHLFILSPQGEIEKDFDIGEPVYGTVSLADLGNNGSLEIIFGTFAGKVQVLHSDGSSFSHFPLSLGASDKITGGCAIADVDNNGSLEIVTATQGGNIFAVDTSANTLPGFPFKTANGIIGSVIAANLKAGPNQGVKIICGDTGGKLYMVNDKGLDDFIFDSQSPIRGTPSLCDINNDGSPEIFFGNNGKKVYGLSFAGNLLEGFPLSLGGNVESQPVFADLYGSGVTNMIVTAMDGKIYSYDFAAQGWSPGFPGTISGQIKSTPTIADIDGDNDLEIAFGTNNSFAILDMKQKGGTTQKLWSTFQANARRTGFSDDILTALPGNEGSLISHTELVQNFPNPFNPTTSIGFSLKNPGQTRLTIFNILGQKVATLVNRKMKSGRHSVTWQARNMPSGIYFYRLVSGDFSQTRRMLLLK